MDETDELPRAIALAWGVAANPQRGPKRELSIEGIVEAAMRLADGGGLAAVSMSAVAGELGFTPMSLYRYVSAKDDLVLLMQECGIGVPPESIRESADWRSGMRAWAAEQLTIFLEHPWLLDIPISGIPITPNNLAWFDAALEVLATTGMPHAERTAVVLAVEAQVRWQGTVRRGSGDHESMARDARMLATLVTPEQFPHIHEAIAAGAFGPDDAAGDPFAFGLERVLDGVAAHLEGHSAPAPAPAGGAVDPLNEQAARDQKYKEAVKARREVEKKLLEARKRERELLKNARERLER